MTRVQNAGPAVDEWYDTIAIVEGCGSSTHDVCKGCLDDVEFYPTLLEPFQSKEPLGEWEVEEMHPPYEEDSYRCAVCRKVLTEEDN